MRILHCTDGQHHAFAPLVALLGGRRVKCCSINIIPFDITGFLVCHNNPLVLFVCISCNIITETCTHYVLYKGKLSYTKITVCTFYRLADLGRPLLRTDGLFSYIPQCMYSSHYYYVYIYIYIYSNNGNCTSRNHGGGIYDNNLFSTGLPRSANL